MDERGNIDERIKRCFTSSTEEIDYLRFYWRLSKPLLRACHISRCLTTARRHSAIFLPARGWPHRLIMLMRNVQTDWLKRRNGVRNFPWTARLIICPWDTRSIMAVGIASYPFYAKWERANGWPFGRVTIRFRTIAPGHTGHFLRPSSYLQSFLRASHIGWPSKSRWATRPALPRFWPTIAEEMQYII